MQCTMNCLVMQNHGKNATVFLSSIATYIGLSSYIKSLTWDSHVSVFGLKSGRPKHYPLLLGVINCLNAWGIQRVASKREKCPKRVSRRMRETWESCKYFRMTKVMTKWVRITRSDSFRLQLHGHKNISFDHILMWFKMGLMFVKTTQRKLDLSHSLYSSHFKLPIWTGLDSTVQNVCALATPFTRRKHSQPHVPRFITRRCFFIS